MRVAPPGWPVDADGVACHHASLGQQGCSRGATTVDMHVAFATRETAYSRNRGVTYGGVAAKLCQARSCND